MTLEAWTTLARLYGYEIGARPKARIALLVEEDGSRFWMGRWVTNDFYCLYKNVNQMETVVFCEERQI